MFEEGLADNLNRASQGRPVMAQLRLRLIYCKGIGCQAVKLVALMRPSHLWQLKDSVQPVRVNDSRRRRAFLQRQMDA